MTVGILRHVVTFQKRTSVPDGDGGTVDEWTNIGSAWSAEIVPATVANMERMAASAIVAAATHIVTGRYRNDIDVHARMTFNNRVFNIAGVQNVDERSIVLRLFVVELL